MYVAVMAGACMCARECRGRDNHIEYGVRIQTYGFKRRAGSDIRVKRSSVCRSRCCERACAEASRYYTVSKQGIHGGDAKATRITKKHHVAATLNIAPETNTREQGDFYVD
jgi:hypothetical protein